MKPRLYTRRPAQVSALRYDGARTLADALAFLGDGTTVQLAANHATFKLASGRRLVVDNGDWIVQLAEGVFYVIDDTTFRVNFEASDRGMHLVHGGAS